MSEVQAGGKEGMSGGGLGAWQLKGERRRKGAAKSPSLLVFSGGLPSKSWTNLTLLSVWDQSSMAIDARGGDWQPQGPTLLPWWDPMKRSLAVAGAQVGRNGREKNQEMGWEMW